MNDEFWMQKALDEADKALRENEVPIGAVVVRDDAVIAAAHNTCVQANDPTCHAERLALAAAHEAIGALDGCTLYVTVEPCAMCAGTLLLYRIQRLVFGAYNTLTGCCGSKIDLTDHWFDASVQTIGGVLETACTERLGRFFGTLRMNSLMEQK